MLNDDVEAPGAKRGAARTSAFASARAVGSFKTNLTWQFLIVTPAALGRIPELGGMVVVGAAVVVVVVVAVVVLVLVLVLVVVLDVEVDVVVDVEVDDEVVGVSDVVDEVGGGGVMMHVTFPNVAFGFSGSFAEQLPTTLFVVTAEVIVVVVGGRNEEVLLVVEGELLIVEDDEEAGDVEKTLVFVGALEVAGVVVVGASGFGGAMEGSQLKKRTSTPPLVA